MAPNPIRRILGIGLVAGLACGLLVQTAERPVVSAQTPQTALAHDPVYDQVKTFSLSGGSADVANLVLTRDRIEMTFTGTFYFAGPVQGQVTGAVFIGQGTFKTQVPASPEFEKDNVKRLLGADVIESDFKTAVLRMTDDTFQVIGASRKPGESVPAAAQKLASDFEPRLLKETGLNLSARVAGSLLNKEQPGVFFAQFDGGRRGRFSAVLDYQTRIPGQAFQINGGEKGLIFTHIAAFDFTQVWLAFYGKEEYGRTVAFSDSENLVDIERYQLDMDLSSVASRLAYTARLDMTALTLTRAIPFKIGEGLGTSGDARLKNQLRLKSAAVGGQPVPAVQEDWEGGFTVFLPKVVLAGEKVVLDLKFEGDYMLGMQEYFYPRSNDIWLPRHGELDRATFDVTYHHAKRHKVASVGKRVSEEPDPANKDLMITKYQMEQPISLFSFAVGAFDRSSETITFENGGPTIPIEFFSLPSAVLSVKTEFLRAELGNAVRYYADRFGRYPYPQFGGVIKQVNYGQGFATLLFIPSVAGGFQGNSIVPNWAVYQFVSHECAHQWWGNIVAWRSYRDLWLSEGFAQYSSFLYTGRRDTPQSTTTLIQNARQIVRDPPRTALGVGKGRLTDIGPIILGSRLFSTESTDAYTGLIYSKGALVLRMLHFLLTNPANGDGRAFDTMMTAFVEKYRNGNASTEDFQSVATAEFIKTPIAQKFALKDLEWFFKQWVRGTELPSYTLEYSLKDDTNGAVIASGTIKQEGVGPDFRMPVPILFSFPNNQEYRTTYMAAGPSTTFELRLPAKPLKVELDPASWILSERTVTKAK